MSTLSWVVAPGLLVVFGWALVSLTGARVTAFGRVAAPAVSFVAGAAALNVITTLLAVLGGPVRPWPVSGPLVVATIAAAVVFRQRRPRDQAGGRPWKLEVAPLVAAVLTVPIVVTSGVQRVVSNDEYAIWALKGRAFAATGHVDTFMFSGEPMLAYSSRDYPLLLPSLQVWAEGWHLSACEPLAIVLVALLSSSALIVASAALGRIAGTASSGLASIAVVALTGFGHRATTFTADIPLTMCGLALVAVVLLHLVPPGPDPPSRRESVIVATALAAACGGLKNEGLALALAVLLAAALARRDQWRVLLPLAGVVGAFAPWAIWCRVHGVESNFVNAETISISALGNLGRIPGLLAAFGEHWPGALILVPLAVAAWTVAFALDRSPVAVVYALSTVFVMGALLAVYVVSPKGDAEFLASNMPRVLLLPAALVATSLPVLAALLLRNETTGRRDRARPQSDLPSGKTAISGARSAGPGF